MDWVCEVASLRGSVEIPGSKSHTIRAVAIASLAGGDSRIRRPLDSQDARAAAAAYRALGASIEMGADEWRVTGVNGRPNVPDDVIDVGNSGTTLNIAMGSCALLSEGAAVLTGDAQIRRRPSGPLAAALNDLGAMVSSTRDNGCAPFVVEGPWHGGDTTIEAVSSQYLTSLLLNAPLAQGETRIDVSLLHEKPYVEMTLDWLRREGIVWHATGFAAFTVPGRQQYRPFDRRIPGDFSSATFFLAAGALPGNDVTSVGLDMTDTQGDKAVVDYLRRMGAEMGAMVSSTRDNGCAPFVVEGPWRGGDTTIEAVSSQYLTSLLLNAPQARIKETDRIAVMKRELEKMGARIEELPDGLVVHGGELHGANVHGHGDHRVIMALAVAASRAKGVTHIHGADAVAVTFPTFASSLSAIGGNIRKDEG
ncbi:MAG: 3-phosphoshikimate 1-carboxyvinyltransferase [Candidatus Hydrogenedentes bacterium]|nr:3-phosphoshikimate 1-carboxyvinyltransferase [Candidatus Hydrogenedentota bacterium]